MTTRPHARVVAILAMACAALLPLSVSAISVAPTASAVTTIVARLGSRGSTVAIIQRVVRVSADGVYGSRTAAAVKVWQRANGCPRPASWTRSPGRGSGRATYAMTTFPTSRQVASYGRRGPYRGASYATRLANTGYAQARYNLASMRKARLASRFMWIDVEPYSIAPWSKSITKNRAVLNGVLRGYRASGFRVGFYSTKYLWAKIMGSARYRLPEWRTAGPRSSTVARGRCASAYSFQGGPAVLAQWWTSSVDHDMTCPSSNTPALLRAYFRKY